MLRGVALLRAEVANTELNCAPASCTMVAEALEPML